MYRIKKASKRIFCQDCQQLSTAADRGLHKGHALVDRVSRKQVSCCALRPLRKSLLGARLLGAALTNDGCAVVAAAKPPPAAGQQQ